MTRLRWALLAAATIAGLAGLLRWPERPGEAPGSRPRPVAALPLNLPAPLPAGTATSQALPHAAQAQPAGSAPAAPRIGSEGYGPHIELAVAGGDPSQAWEAVRWMRQCTSNEGRRASFEKVRDQGVSPEMMTQMMVEADAEARLCQTVTAQHRALLPELATRALRAGVPEAASAYAGAVFPGELTPAQRREVADALRHDALAGHPASLLNAALSNEAWGLGDAERLSYLLAYAELPDPAARSTAMSLLGQGSLRLKAPPTPEQMAAARLAGQQIMERARVAGSP